MSGSYLNDLWEWSPVTSTWSNIGKQAVSVPNARSNLGFTRLGDSLIVYGGLGASGHKYMNRCIISYLKWPLNMCNCMQESLGICGGGAYEIKFGFSIKLQVMCIPELVME
jgi:hypothetical protein